MSRVSNLGDHVWDLILGRMIRNQTGMNMNRPAQAAKKATRKRVQAARKANRR